MPPNRQEPTTFIRIGETLYLLSIALSFYLLLLSRTGEAHTVWEALHPAFIPTLFVATSLLIIILQASENMSYKLLFVIVHSVLIHSLFSIIFPAGDLSGQQTMLGRTRLVYENAVLYGGFPPGATIQSLVYDWFRGENSQAALTVVLARMFNIDLLWAHLFLVPVLWGIFTPIAAYLTTNNITQNDKVSVLASALIAAFPNMTYFGAISVPQSLGFILFFYSLYFMTKYLSSNDSKCATLMVVFSFFSFLFHNLAGIMSFSLFFLALAFKSYRSQKNQSATAKFPLVIAFVVSISLLPLSLIYLRLFHPAFKAVFTLDNFHEMPLQEILGRFLLGELIYGFGPEQILLLTIGPTIALLSAIYLVHYSRRNTDTISRALFCFFFAAFLIMLIDYRILKLFMRGLPFSEERLWAFRDFIAAPFVALATYAVFSWLQSFLKANSLQTTAFVSLKKLPKGNVQRVASLLLALNVLIAVLLGGWIMLSLSVAYPQVAPLQTTSYELEAVKYIDGNTHEKYVVIGDIWTIYAGERIVGIKNPRAYYFLEYNRTGYELFVNMTMNPSPQWMLLALNRTDTNVAYFIVTEPRLGTEEFNSTVSKALQNDLPVYATFGDRKLYIFYYER